MCFRHVEKTSSCLTILSFVFSEIEDGIEVVTVSSTQLSDDQQFWLGIVEQNLCDLVFQEIHSALESMKQDLITYCVRGEGIARGFIFFVIPCSCYCLKAD